MSSDWCSRIPDNARINDLAIPGTHDSAAWTHHWNVPGSPGTWAQRKNITEQLNLGIRVLDLRVGYASNNWTLGISSFVGMFHGPIYVGTTLVSVLTEIDTWLGQNPQELVILVFQQQGKSGQRDVADEVGTMVRATFGQRLFTFRPQAATWPTVGRLRGKVLALGRLRSAVAGFCDVRSWLTTGDNTDGALIDAGANLRLYLQDRYKGLSKDEGYDSMHADNRKKVAKVEAAARAAPGALDWHVLRVNHASYSNLRYQPWQSGEGVNALLRAATFRVRGAMMIDDADQATVDWILGWNP
jgi:hypothetical protein